MLLDTTQALRNPEQLSGANSTRTNVTKTQGDKKNLDLYQSKVPKLYSYSLLSLLCTKIEIIQIESPIFKTKNISLMKLNVIKCGLFIQHFLINKVKKTLFESILTQTVAL